MFLSKRQLKETLIDGASKVTKDIYTFEKGLRKISPYVHTFRTFVGGKLVGKSLKETIKNLPCSFSQEYYERAISYGLVRINDEPTDLSQ